MEFGVKQGWWEDIDAKGNPIPFATIISIKKLTAKNPNSSLAHAFVEAKVFESISDAKKSGWNKPLVIGEFWFNQRTKRVRIIK